ncbi:MAG TPA: thymidine kinase, partial [Bacilli bacterium]|nr:thymidine kinase [Bacilli bacterium]
MDLKCSDGWIEVICGSMFAGKTEELIRRITRIQLAKREVVIFKPVIDDRYGKSDIVSHSQRRIKSIPVNDSSEIMANLKGYPYAVAIDEAQFFDKGLVEVAENLANHGVRVIIAGLDLNFKGE